MPVPEHQIRTAINAYLKAGGDSEFYVTSRKLMTPAMLNAQLAALNWIIGRCEDQFARAWLVSERELLKRTGAPVNQSGGGM